MHLMAIPYTDKTFSQATQNDNLPCLALNGLECSGYPSLPIKGKDLITITGEGSSQQKMIIVKKSMEQFRAQEVCNR